MNNIYCVNIYVGNCGCQAVRPRNIGRYNSVTCESMQHFLTVLVAIQ